MLLKNIRITYITNFSFIIYTYKFTGLCKFVVNLVKLYFLKNSHYKSNHSNQQFL